jgi:peptidylprolyl isomerase
MRQAKQGDTVKVHYTGTLKDGTVFDTSKNREPLEVTLGRGAVIRGFENAVVGMSVGETKEFEIGAADGYGPRREELVIQVEKKILPQDVEPQEGMALRLKGPEQEVIPAVITEVSDDTVTIDANHPLSGQDLMFVVELAEIA